MSGLCIWVHGCTMQSIVRSPDLWDKDHEFGLGYVEFEILKHLTKGPTRLDSWRWNTEVWIGDTNL